MRISGPNSEKTSAKIIITILSLIVVIVAITVFYLYQNNWQFNMNNQPPKKQIITIDLKNESQEIAKNNNFVLKKDWLAFEDEFIAIQYPQKWQPTFDNNGYLFSFMVDEDSELFFMMSQSTKEDDYTNLDDFTNQYIENIKTIEKNNYLPRDILKFKHNGKPMNRISITPSQTYKENTVIIDYNDYLWFITYPIQANQEDLLWNTQPQQNHFDKLNEIFQSLILK